ncbi:MAG: ATP-grasp domain-containing protein [Gemmataceae bacterium]
MRIGITYDLKEPSPTSPAVAPSAGLPDDFYEEFDSIDTIDAIARVLTDLGHDVEKLGDGRELIQRLLSDPPELVFNFAEGQGVGRTREARVPALLEMLNIPYTGSDPLTFAVTLDKDCAKRLVASENIGVPAGAVIAPGEVSHADIEALESDLRFPLIVKPAWEGSSKGIRSTSLVSAPGELAEVIARMGRDYRQPVLVEEFIDGDEITVGVLGNEKPAVMGVMRVVPTEATARFVYSLEVKRDFRKRVRYECPAPVPAEALVSVEEAALEVYRVLGCRDVARIDFRLREGVPYFLEANPLPGLTPGVSDLVIMAELLGWNYSRLVEAILKAALDRLGRSGVREAETVTC